MGDVQKMIDECLSHKNTLETPVNRTEFGKAYGWDGVAWCHIFLSVCAEWSGNRDVIPWTAGCWTGQEWFRKRGQYFRRGQKTPKPGDLVYYGSNGSDHVGLVYKVGGGLIYTVEGNTSNSSGYNPNGGGVHTKKWPLSYSRIHGYGRPAYSSGGSSGGSTSHWTEDIVQKLPLLKKGSRGEHVETLQALCNARSHKITIDGDFGPATERAVKAIQKWGGVASDGEVGRNTWPVLLRVH